LGSGKKRLHEDRFCGGNLIMTRFISFTHLGFQKIKEEKENILIKRKTAVENLRTAREMGDLSENAAYKVARGQLSAIDSRIRHLDYLVRCGRVETAPQTGEIGIGSKVELLGNEKEMKFEIVGSFESNPAAGKISHISPLGKELMGKKAGDNITVHSPNGTVSYQVMSVK